MSSDELPDNMTSEPNSSIFRAYPADIGSYFFRNNVNVLSDYTASYPIKHYSLVCAVDCKQINILRFHSFDGLQTVCSPASLLPQIKIIMYKKLISDTRTTVMTM
jgi:hypothetical protein